MQFVKKLEEKAKEVKVQVGVQAKKVGDEIQKAVQ